MIKKYETYKSGCNLSFGDRVIVKNRDSKYFMKTGTVTFVINRGNIKGDVELKMDDDERVTFFYTNLEKIEEIVEFPSGEVFKVLYNNAIELLMAGVIKFNTKWQYYYFDEKDKWQIEDMIL